MLAAVCLSTLNAERPTKKICSGLEYPLLGKWDDQTVPRYYPFACTITTLNRSVIDACVSNRTFIFVGNSVARGYAFTLHAMTTNTTAATRNEQKKIVEKHGNRADVILPVGESGRVRFLWQLYVSNPPPYSMDMNYGMDFCHTKNYYACVSGFIRESKSNDVFLFHYGIIYALFLTIYPGHEKRTLDDILPDQDIVTFLNFVKINFLGKHIIWITTPHQKGDIGDLYYPYLSAIDSKIYKILRCQFINDRKWLILDAASIASHAEFLYTDEFHHLGLLSETIILSMLNTVC